ncbi:MAG: bifunctional demethylmenaquinone methyltransferase/2-methoxy-6-polyprenyl-1,4-benzoquinol methylase UbiE [Desulfobacca sp.]|nr:bifunctional demethylmenaquinone methyltransferase/2-methoxy-6-polyprenyl-1,4-benzoquinol methylase UbiE [Desulfobacca sp.]
MTGMASGAPKYPSIKDLSNEDRIRLVRRIFSSVTDRYDFLNRLLSARRDVAWRRFMIQKLHFFSTHRLLDLATGTGDVALGSARQHGQVKVIGLDFAKPMLEVAREKVDQAGLTSRIFLMQGDAMNLPFAEGCFDAVTVAFGVRNMPDRKRVFEEMARVLVPGGKIHVLELTAPQSRWFRALYLPYLNHVLPRLSRWFTKDPAAYQYLAESILHFPSPDELAREMEKAGLEEVEKFPLSLGITNLHQGRKPL